MNNPQLFVIYIGGTTKNALIELHDMRFVIANSIEETYPELKKTWWGTPESLHLDCWGALTSVENYNIHLKKTPAEQEINLYFVNMGGYDSKQFTELHKNVFVTATSEQEAKTKAKSLKEISHWEVPHKDYLYEVEHCFCVNKVLEEQSFYIHLKETNNPSPFNFICKYTPIGKT